MANQVGLSLFGYENLDEVAGKNLSVFIAPEDFHGVGVLATAPSPTSAAVSGRERALR